MKDSYKAWSSYDDTRRDNEATAQLVDASFLKQEQLMNPS